jgi:Peptidase family M48
MMSHTFLSRGTAAIVYPAGCGAVTVALVLAGTSAAAQTSSTTRSQDLVKMDPAALVRFVDESRPAPVSAVLKDRVLAGLPKKGVVENLDEDARRKLAAVVPVLEAARRASVYTIKVIDVPEAFVGLHARTVLLISLPILRLVSDHELRALVAHETGHEYVHAEYERAMAAGNSGRLQDLELVCDIIGVVTLYTIGQKASSLVAGIEKILRSYPVRFGREMEHPDYPSFVLRRSVVLGLEQKISRAAGPR